ncbi:MAG: hypothetical protein ACWGNV_08850 [Bacteroidales bacterium]
MNNHAPLLTLLIILMLQGNFLQAQHDAEGLKPDHHHKHHELGIGTGAVYFANESAWGMGFHLHGTVGVTEWMGIGPGYELILGENTHHSLTALFNFDPFHPFDFSIGPGVVFPGEEVGNFRFKLHTELAFAFEVGEHLHLGPSLEAGIVKDDLHLSVGIHIGYIFTPGE